MLSLQHLRYFINFNFFTGGKKALKTLHLPLPLNKDYHDLSMIIDLYPWFLMNNKFTQIIKFLIQIVN